MKPLTEKQMFNKLNKYYKEKYKERDTDEWCVNPAYNIWKFERNNKTIILICDIYTGEITEKKGI